MGSHPFGRVVCVTVGHGVRGGGSVVTPQVTDCDVDVVVLAVVVGLHGWLSVRTSRPHPLYGHPAWHGAMSVAVGTAMGQSHGFWMVVTNMQPGLLHCRPHEAASSVLVTTGQFWPSAVDAVSTAARKAAIPKCMVSCWLL